MLAKTIQEAVRFHQKSVHTVVSHLAIQVAREAVAQRSTFPFVTLHLFEELGAEARSVPGVDFVLWAPYVKQSQSEAWSAFFDKERGWVNESGSFCDGFEGGELGRQDCTSSPGSLTSFPYVINETGVPVPSTNEVMQPIWQLSPLSDTLLQVLNFDVMNTERLGNMHNAMSVLQRPLFGDLHKVANVFKKLVRQSTFSNGETGPTPFSMLAHPVMNSSDSSVVGHVYAAIFWDEIFRGLLPEIAPSVFLILNNTCGGQFTFEVRGSEVSQHEILCFCHHYFSGQLILFL